MERVEKREWNWQPIIELAIVLITVLGSTITLYLHTDSKMNQEIAAQSARTDKLYEIWVDTQKEIKQLYVEILKDKNNKE